MIHLSRKNDRLIAASNLLDVVAKSRVQRSPVQPQLRLVPQLLRKAHHSCNCQILTFTRLIGAEDADRHFPIPATLNIPSEAVINSKSDDARLQTICSEGIGGEQARRQE